MKIDRRELRKRSGAGDHVRSVVSTLNDMIESKVKREKVIEGEMRDLAHKIQSGLRALDLSRLSGFGHLDRKLTKMAGWSRRIAQLQKELNQINCDLTPSDRIELV